MLPGLRRLMRGESNIDFIGRSRVWLFVSIVVLALSLSGLLVKKLNLGLEFEGGTALTVQLENDVTVAQAEDALTGFDIGQPQVQISTAAGGTREMLVRAEQISSRDTLREVQAELARLAGQVDGAGQPDIDAVSITDVGARWGRQISNKALRGLIVFLILVSLYISLRFEWKMAIGALAALFHDLISTAGIYALVGFEVTPATVIALLTLMGFSLYDTVVVFDKVRENGEAVTSGGKLTYSQMVNGSLNQVLVRSINTSLSSVLPVAGLLFVGVFLFGADTLKDLALAMFIGALVSTYSSIFVAAPLLVWLKEKEPRYRQLRERLSSARGPQPAMATASASAPAVTDVEQPPAPSPVTVRTGIPRPPPRGRQKRGGKRRR